MNEPAAFEHEHDATHLRFEDRLQVLDELRRVLRHVVVPHRVVANNLQILRFGKLSSHVSVLSFQGQRGRAGAKSNRIPASIWPAKLPNEPPIPAAGTPRTAPRCLLQAQLAVSIRSL